MKVKTLEKAVSQVIGAILRYGAKRATKYLSPTETVKATLQGGTYERARRRQDTILITFGRPNYAEQQFIKLAKKAGEPFPIRKVQIKTDAK